MKKQKIQKLVSVIIPTFNRGETLKLVLPSYITQKEIKEIIIVDDHSSDSTKSIVSILAKTSPKLKYFRNVKNMGAPESRNIGVSKASFPFIFFGEDDVELTPQFMHILFEHLEKTGADIIAGRRIWMQKGETQKDAIKRANAYKPEPINNNLVITNFQVPFRKDLKVQLLDASMLVPKDILVDTPYDANYRQNAWREETDFQISAAKKGHKLYFCPHTVCYHLYKEKDKGGNHASSLLNYELNVFKNNAYMTKKHWDFIQKNFNVSNYYMYLLQFSLHRILGKYLIPLITKRLHALR